MPSDTPKTQPVSLHPRPLPPPTAATANPLPPLLQTPSGLALLELQGTINLPLPPPAHTEEAGAPDQVHIPIGRLHFPDYRPEGPGQDGNGSRDSAWMKRVYLYVGDHQRLQGEVKKLSRAMAVVRRRGKGKGKGEGNGNGNGNGRGSGDGGSGGEGEGEGGEDELEVAEIVKYKIVFSHRPEPVGGSG